MSLEKLFVEGYDQVLLQEQVTCFEPGGVYDHMNVWKKVYFKKKSCLGRIQFVVNFIKVK
ncbi:MAG: hypothetical protein ABL876_09395 [Chitinophagaceae bacterium]